MNNDFKQEIKVNMSEIKDKDLDMKMFIQKLENNPNLVEKLSDERLQKLINYYIKLTNENRKKIDILKRKRH